MGLHHGLHRFGGRDGEHLDVSNPCVCLRRRNLSAALLYFCDLDVYKRQELGRALFRGIYRAAQEAGVYLAAQCCEHLNRALILEQEAAVKYGWEEVNVVPQPKAGGSFATAAYGNFAHPAAVEHIKAHAGMDIGDTLIGMHLRDVAVPVRISAKNIGAAHLVCARTRRKYIGGQRASYEEWA